MQSPSSKSASSGVEFGCKRSPSRMKRTEFGWSALRWQYASKIYVCDERRRGRALVSSYRVYQTASHAQYHTSERVTSIHNIIRIHVRYFKRARAHIRDDERRAAPNAQNFKHARPALAPRSYSPHLTHPYAPFGTWSCGEP